MRVLRKSKKGIKQVIDINCFLLPKASIYNYCHGNTGEIRLSLHSAFGYMVRVMEFEMRVLAYVKIRIRVLFWQSSSAFEMAGLSAIADNRIICRPTALLQVML